MARRKRNGVKHAYKSNWEKQVADILVANGIPVVYEADVIPYTVPQSNHKYKPDFKIRDGVYIESKGIFDAKDRQKILLLKEQRPDITILMLFQNANQKLYKGGKSSYGDWCTKNGIAWSHKIIKKEWLREAT